MSLTNAQIKQPCAFLQEQKQLAKLRGDQAEALQRAAETHQQAQTAKQAAEQQMSELQQQVTHLQTQHASLKAELEPQQTLMDAARSMQV